MTLRHPFGKCRGVSIIFWRQEAGLEREKGTDLASGESEHLRNSEEENIPPKVHGRMWPEPHVLELLTQLLFSCAFTFPGFSNLRSTEVQRDQVQYDISRDRESKRERETTIT